MKVEFLAIGEILADLISTDYCEGLEDAVQFRIYPGGSPANVAANLIYLNKKAALIGCVGNDGIGKFLLNEIRQNGLSVTLVQVSERQPTSIVMVGKSKGTPDFIVYRGADTQLKLVDQELLQATTIVHTTAFALSRQPAQKEIISAFMKARELGKVISLDWNFAPAIWGEDDGRAIFNQLMDLKPYLKVSLDDMERFFGKSKSVDEYKAILDTYDSTLICLTCGKDGVWYKEENLEWKFRESLAVPEVVETTGAGDAFWAGFIASLLDHQSIDDCITNALTLASRKIQKQGPLYHS